MADYKSEDAGGQQRTGNLQAILVGGVFQLWTFGFTWRNTFGQSGLATLYDVNVDYTMNQHLAFAAVRGDVTERPRPPHSA